MSFRSLLNLTALGIATIGWCQPNYVPDPLLRDVLNGFIPDLVGSDGYITDPGAYIGDMSFPVDWTPCDLTGLEFVSCNTMVLSFDPTIEVTAFPSFPAISGTDPGFQLWYYPGTDLPAQPAGLAYLILDGATQLQNWTIAGSPGQPIGSVELHNFPTSSAWPSSVSYVDNFTAETCDGDQPFVIGNGVRNAWYSNLPYLATMPNLSPDQEYMSIGGCPSITSGWATPQVANNPILEFGGMDGLQSLTNFPTFVDSLSVDQAPVLATLAIPGSLIGLSLGNVPLLPAPVFPAGLKHLSIGGEGPWGVVPTLPAMLETFAVGDIPIYVELPPAFPNTLRSFTAYYCSFAEDMPLLPEGVTEITLISVYNEFTQAAFPSALETLTLQSCSLTDLPALPEGLLQLVVTNCGVTCLPPLPMSLVTLSADMACYPNQPPGVPQLTLCSILISYCPEVNPTISGHVFLDLNRDGEQGPGEKNYTYGTLRFLPSNFQTGIDTAGNYSIALPIGEYTVELTGLVYPFSDLSPMQYVQELVTVNDNADSLNFAISAPTDLPVERQVYMRSMEFARPGFSHSLVFNAFIDGYHEDTTIVTITYDPFLSLSAVQTNSPYTIVGNVITIKVPPDHPDLLFEGVRLNVPAIVPLGTLLTAQCSVGPATNDPNLDNNSITLDYHVLGAFDPNDKQVLPAVLTPSEVAADTLVEYMIRFQNTGTYLAERVLITDTLSADLRWDSFRFNQSSHPCEWFMRDGVVHFVFNEIMLPDSNANEPESHGFVSFSIRPSMDLLLGETVVNEANIYFDFNEPVITDPCILTIDMPDALPDTRSAKGSAVYPIPAIDHLTVVLPQGALYSGEVIATDGRVLQRISNLRSKQRIDVSTLPSGTYLLVLNSSIASGMRERFIKQ